MIMVMAMMVAMTLAMPILGDGNDSGDDLNDANDSDDDHGDDGTMTLKGKNEIDPFFIRTPYPVKKYSDFWIRNSHMCKNYYIKCIIFLCDEEETRKYHMTNFG